MKLITCLIALTIGQSAFADSLFEQCQEVIESKSYQPLKQYLLEKKEQGDSCQRLNNYEFIYTTERNFYYCNFKAKDNICSEDRADTWYPNLELTSRFSGENGKRFVLFRVSRLSRGIYTSGYHVFFLTPKTENPRGYRVSSLNGAGEYNGSYSDAGKACSNLDKSDRAIEPLDGHNAYVILNEGKNNVSVRFTQNITFCETQQTSAHTLEYIWSGSGFIRSNTATN